MEEDAPYFENGQSLPNLNSHDESTENSEGYEDVWSQNYFDEVIEHSPIAECSSSNQPKHVCEKCVKLDLELQKSKLTISKLQKRCIEKTAEIKRLRAIEKRSNFAKNSLQEILREIKNKKWISDEGQQVLNVITQNLKS